MPFTIVVTTPGRVGSALVPGQKVSGKVVFIAANDNEKVNDVQVIFQGKALSQVTVSNGQSSSHYKERIVLFRYVSQLSRERQVFNRSQHTEWPFEFITPATSEYTRESNTAGAMFAANGLCPLPPSLEFQRTGFGGRNGKAYVRYKLKVVANDSRLFHRHKIVKYLNYTNSVPRPWPAPQISQFLLSEQQWQSRSLRSEDHTLKQKMRHIFTSDPSLKNPSITFAAYAIMPAALTYGQTAPLSIAIRHRTVAPTDPDSPTLILDQLSLEMQSRTWLRVKHSSWSRTYEDEGKANCNWRHYRPDPPPSLPLDGTLLTVDECLSIGDRPGTGSCFQPDFKTYNIAQTHAVKIHVRIRHGESGHVFAFDQKLAFSILPACVEAHGPAEFIQPAPSEYNPTVSPESTWAELHAQAPPAYESLSSYSKVPDNVADS